MVLFVFANEEFLQNAANETVHAGLNTARLFVFCAKRKSRWEIERLTY